MSLVDSATLIQEASDAVALRTNAQLEVIVEQIRALPLRARAIIDQAARDAHRYFSMVSPDEYGGTASGYLASYCFEHDQSWTRLDEMTARHKRRAEIQGFVASRALAAAESE